MWGLGKPRIGQALLIGCAVAVLAGSWLTFQRIPLNTLGLWTKYHVAKGLNSIGMSYYEVTWPAESGKALTTVEELIQTPGLQIWADHVSRKVGIVVGPALGSGAMAFGLLLLWPAFNRSSTKTQDRPTPALKGSSLYSPHTLQPATQRSPPTKTQDRPTPALKGSSLDSPHTLQPATQRSPSTKTQDRPTPALKGSSLDSPHTLQPTTQRELPPKDPVTPGEVPQPAPASAASVAQSTARSRVKPSGKAPIKAVSPSEQTPLAEPPATPTLDAVPTPPAEPVKLAKSYLGYWSLAELPFVNVPDSKYYFPSPMHEEALHRLLYGIETQKGALMLTGEIGCGKTLLSRALFSHLSSQEYDLALMVNPALEVNQFLSETLYQLGIQASGPKVELIHRLDNKLLENHKRGLRTVLVVDEAHIIQDELLFEELRLLLNFQLNDRFLLTLVLIGQPELNERVLAIKQFAQRISIRYHLGTFNDDETAEYVKFRLKAAGSVKEIFTPSALHGVFRHSGGIPRNINTLCDLALLTGYMENATSIDIPTVERAAAEREPHVDKRRKVARGSWTEG